MREIVLGLEVTGFYPEYNDKIIEIGAVELKDGSPTGKTFHSYINPERSIPRTATQLTGLNKSFLKDKSTFAEAVPEFLAFIKKSRLIIHNAPFDISFLNNELEKNGFPLLKNKVTDTLVIARKLYPKEKNTINALSVRLNINKRTDEMPNTLKECYILAEILKQIKYRKEHKIAYKNVNTIKEVKNYLKRSGTGIHVWQIKGMRYGAILKYKDIPDECPLIVRTYHISKIEDISSKAGITLVFYSEKLSLSLYQSFKKGIRRIPCSMYKDVAESLRHCLEKRNDKTLTEEEK